VIGDHPLAKALDFGVSRLFCSHVSYRFFHMT
jgi:hypothetical protein